MEELQKLRTEIDGIYQLTNGLNAESKKNDNFTSEQIKDCCKSLLMGKAWCGKLMGYLGGTTPYKNDGKRKEVSDIEPTDAVAKVSNQFSDGEKEVIWSDITYIQKVDKLRQDIDEQVKALVDFTVPQGSSREANIARTNAFNFLSNARLDLGFEMERLKGGR